MRLQHVSVAIPPGGAEAARAFYGGLIGLEERDVLPALDPDQHVHGYAPSAAYTNS